MSNYYKVDMSKISFAEAWRMGGIRYIVFFALLKLSGVKRYGPELVPASDWSVRIEPTEIGEKAHAKIEPELRELRSAGFEVAYWSKANTQGPGEGFMVTTINQYGDTIGRVIYSKSGAREQVSTSLVSVSADGKYLATGNARLSFSPPPQIDGLRLLDKSTAEIIRRHSQRVGQMSAPPVRITDAESVALELQRIAKDHYIQRGLYVPA